jgi:hypothetical protein
MNLSKKLSKELTYFVENPNKRCRDIRGNCRYSGKTLGLDTEGCLIGRMMSEDVRVRADRDGVDGIDDLLEYLDEKGLDVEFLRDKNVDVLRDFQDLHDNSSYWEESGLSDRGRERLRDYIYNGSLDISDFSHLLT